jgi:hypothetical protein
MMSDTILMAAVVAVWTFNLSVLLLIVLNLSVDMYRRRKRGW